MMTFAQCAVPIAVFVLAGWVNQGLAAPQENQANGEPLKQLSLAELGNVEVTTTSKKPEKVWNTPAAIYVLTQEDIRRSGATSIPEVLRLVPGVEVSRINSNIWSVGIRGFGSAFSKSVLVLIDGRSVYTPLFAGVDWNKQNVMLEDVERIEVIRGPGGTIWGSNAVNGVINIITKSAADTQGLYAEAGGGSQPQGFAGVRYGGALAPGTQFRVYGKYIDRGDEVLASGNSESDAWRQGRGGFRVDSELSAQDRLTLQGDFYGGSEEMQAGEHLKKSP